MTVLIALAAAATALSILLAPFAILVNLMPLQRLLLSLAGTTGGNAPRFGVSEATRRTGALLRYLAFRIPLPDDGFYSALERAHMSDVQSIFQSVYLVAFAACLLAGVLLLLIRRNRDRALQAVRIGAVAVLAVVLALEILSLTGGFDRLFVAFHEAVFSNDFWLLPADSGLIRLFPETYFMSYFFVTLSASAVIAGFLAVIPFRRRLRPF